MKTAFSRIASASILVSAVSFATSSAIAAGGHSGMMGEVGQPGDPSKVTRTIQIEMFDNYYEPENVSIKEGETVKFVIKNSGEFVHEFNIGTAAMHADHQSEMMMMMEHGVLLSDRIDWDAAKAMQQSMGHGMHDDANSALLEPGQEDEIVWQFPEHAELEFACNVPGHYDSGMMGQIKLSH